MKEKFYVTTPIYYGNGLPHVGHFYSSTIANTIFRYQKIAGKDARFTTGIDENSQKAVIKAEEAGMEIMEYLDSMACEHKKVWDHFDFKYTDFIRTTSQRHHKVVQDVLQKCFDKGDIYEGEYEGMYCVGCESFKKDEDLVYMNKTTKETFPISDKVKESDNIIKVCPDHLKAPDQIKEKNYFFKLSKYQTWMEEFYQQNPDFVEPSFRFNEVIAFTKRGLEDFSISRETNTFGIPLPFDTEQVTYVWFDALFNYYTSCIASRWGDKDSEDFVNEKEFWEKPEGENGKILHVVGKDIIRFHAIFWPAMLASYFNLGEEIDGVLHYKKEDNKYLPDNILAWGFFTVDGQKMSKSIGNVIEPIEYSEKYSKDLLTLYMLSAFSIGNDGDYDRKDAILNYNAKLANNFGNLLNRAVVLTMKLKLEEGLIYDYSDKPDTENLWGEVWEFHDIEGLYRGHPYMILGYYQEDFTQAMKNYNLKEALDCTFKFLDAVNLYVTQTEPWTLMKDESKSEEVKEIMYTICESLRQVAMNLYPYFPEKMTEVLQALSLEGYPEVLEEGKLDELKNRVETFNIVKKAPILFQKFEIEE